MEQRLQKLIATAGIASRRHAEELIVAGRVTVNGAVVKELGTKADPDVDDVRVDGRRLKAPARRLYLLLNKPRGYISSRADPQHPEEPTGAGLGSVPASTGGHFPSPRQANGHWDTHCIACDVSGAHVSGPSTVP